MELRLAAGGRRRVEAVTARRRAAIRSIAARLPPSVLDTTVASMQAFAEAAGEPAGDDIFGWQLVTVVER